jgi:hypothetical protein
MRIFLIAVFNLISLYSYSKPVSIDTNYLKVYETLENMLSKKEPASFKYAVFLTENLSMDNALIYSKFDEHITKLATLVKYWMEFNTLKDYHYSDSLNVHRNYALYTFFKDTLKMSVSPGGDFFHLPYTYDFNDFSGEKDWRMMFVTKLLITHTGNCHSLPYLYKILADEIDAKCWLALAPNHMYISNRCEKIGWYNTELTSGDFPIDSWIMASGYLPLQAVQNGIYMDTLSNQQSIALCVLDLAKGYEHKVRNYSDGFILKCCDLSLQYFPLNVQALLLKAETLKHIYEQEKLQKAAAAKGTYRQMEQLYMKLFDLGYREMPDQMYIQWLQSVVKERDKYLNKKVNQIVDSNK